MSLAKVLGLPTGITLPHLLPSSISAGPVGQSAETTGKPNASASANALPNPSHLDESTKTELCFMYLYGISTNPGIETSLSRPSCLTSCSSLAHSGPFLKFISLASVFFLIKGKALINVGKFLCGCKLPTPKMTGGCPGWNQGGQVALPLFQICR